MRRPSGLALLGTALAAWTVGLSLWVSSSGEWRFAAGFAVALLWRVAFGSDGRGLLPRRGVGLLLGLLLAAGVPYLLDLASAGGGTRFFEGVLGTLTCFLGVALLAPLSAFGVFWIVLLTSTQVAVAASLTDQLGGAVLLVGCVALLCATLLLLERATAPLAAPARRIVDPRARPARALARAGLRLAALGLATGTLLWIVAPRSSSDADDAARRPVWDTEAQEASSRHGAASRTGGAVVGPDATSDEAVLGVVDRIQQDNRVHLEARLLAGAEEPTVYLREGVRDLWLDAPGSAAPRWRSSRALERARLGAEANGVTTVGEPTPGHAQRTLEVTYRLGSALLFLEPEALRFTVLRPTGPEPNAARSVVEGETRRLGSGRLERQLLPGDLVETTSQPQRRGGSDLAGRESSARVSPLTSYASIDPVQAARLRGLVGGVPGLAGADAWQRARTLEAWLQGPQFEYQLASPALAPGRRVEDFLTRVRRGNCEWYATALTLLLRAHGHAARYVQGYWGGSHTAGSRVWTFHGTSYHAWTELFLDGVGWVPLNPTPPERLAALAGGRTTEAGRHGATQAPGATSAPLSARLRDWGASAWHWMGASLEGRHGGGARWAVLGGLALLLVGGMLARRRQRRAAGGRGAPRPPDSALAQALTLLGRRGFARPRSWTAREYLARTGAGLRLEAHDALARIATRHERRWYAGIDEPEGPDREDLRALTAALRADRPARA